MIFHLGACFFGVIIFLDCLLLVFAIEGRQFESNPAIIRNRRYSSILEGVVSVLSPLGENIVYLGNFYDEHNLSFAKTSIFSVNDSENDSLAISSLSLNGSSFTNSDVAYPINSLAWSRSWYRQMYLVRKSGHPGNFAQLAGQIKKIVHFANSTKLPLAAIRYHTYSSYCKLLRDLGNPSLLPIPVILTFKLNPDIGHLSADVEGKTCIRQQTYSKDTQICRQSIILPSYLRRCRRTMKDVTTFISNPKILLLITNQHVAFSSEKVMVLPLGVRPNIAPRALEYIHRRQQREQTVKFNRSVLLGITNSITDYQEKIVRTYRRKFGISSTLIYDANDGENIRYSSLPDYFDLLASAKFTLCPPGLNGFDSHRIWESLLLGSIPVVEASPAGPSYERAFSLLPVLVVPDILALTRQDFDSAYNCFAGHTNKWNYELLTQRHWDEMILSSLKHANIQHYTGKHPPYNPYCNFWLYNQTKKWN